SLSKAETVGLRGWPKIAPTFAPFRTLGACPLASTDNTCVGGQPQPLPILIRAVLPLSTGPGADTPFLPKEPSWNRFRAGAESPAHIVFPATDTRRSPIPSSPCEAGPPTCPSEKCRRNLRQKWSPCNIVCNTIYDVVKHSFALARNYRWRSGRKGIKSRIRGNSLGTRAPHARGASRGHTGDGIGELRQALSETPGNYWNESSLLSLP